MFSTDSSMGGFRDFLYQAELEKALQVAHAEIKKMKSPAPDHGKQTVTRKGSPGATAEVPPAKKPRSETAPTPHADADTPATPSGSRPPRGSVAPQARLFNIAQQQHAVTMFNTL